MTPGLTAQLSSLTHRLEAFRESLELISSDTHLSPPYLPPLPSPSDFKFPRSTLRTFRVTELKDVLRMINARMSGNRAELLDRIVLFYDDISTRTQTTSAIQTVRQNMLSGFTSTVLPVTTLAPQASTTHTLLHRPFVPGGASSSSSSSFAGSASASSSAATAYQFAHNPFIKNVFMLVPTITLDKGINTGQSWMSGKRFEFSLTGDHIAMLENLDYRVYIRCGAIPQKDPKKHFTNICVDTFPKATVISINGVQIAEELTRKSKPYEITGYLRSLPPAKFSPKNRIELSGATSYANFIFQVFLGQEETIERIIKALRHTSREEGLQLVRKKLSPSGSDDVVVANSGGVKLTCPLGMVRMSHPCRGPTCSHLQCFDADIYFRMGQRTLKWKCPVCDKQLVPEEVRIDDYVVEVIREARDESMVEFLEDGSWRIQKEEFSDQDTPEPGAGPAQPDISPPATIIDGDTPPATLQRPLLGAASTSARAVDGDLLPSLAGESEADAAASLGRSASNSLPTPTLGTTSTVGSIPADNVEISKIAKELKALRELLDTIPDYSNQPPFKLARLDVPQPSPQQAQPTDGRPPRLPAHPMDTPVSFKLPSLPTAAAKSPVQPQPPRPPAQPALKRVGTVENPICLSDDEL